MAIKKSTGRQAEPGAKLNYLSIFRGLTLSTPTKREAMGVAEMILAKDGFVSEADRSQLRELALLLGRMEQANQMLTDVMAQGDSDQWIKLSRMAEAMTTSKRGLLRDLKATRYIRPSDTGDTVAERKATEKSGGGWKGVV